MTSLQYNKIYKVLVNTGNYRLVIIANIYGNIFQSVGCFGDSSYVKILYRPIFQVSSVENVNFFNGCRLNWRTKPLRFEIMQYYCARCDNNRNLSQILCHISNKWCVVGYLLNDGDVVIS